MRRARAADVPALARALARLPLMKRYGRTAARLAESLRTGLRKKEPIFVFDDGGPLGLAWGVPGGGFGLGGYLKLLAVSPGAQGRGLGALLLAAFEADTFAKSAHACLLVSDFNTEAQRFYERHGYQRVGALPGLVVPGVAELVYWKKRSES